MLGFWNRYVEKTVRSQEYMVGVLLFFLHFAFFGGRMKTPLLLNDLCC